MPPLLVGEALAFRSATSSIGNFSAPPLAAVVAVASGLTDCSRAVSTKKEDPLSELQLREGVFFLVSQMTSSISTFTIYSICHSPQKSSFAQKVYKRPLRHACGVPLPGLRLPASASLPLASCWPLPQQLLPVSAAGGGRRRCSQRERLWQSAALRLP